MHRLARLGRTNPSRRDRNPPSAAHAQPAALVLRERPRPSGSSGLHSTTSGAYSGPLSLLLETGARLKLEPVPRVHAKDFQPPRFGGKPQVVLHAVDDWAALHAWHPDYLKVVTGNVEVPVRETDGPPKNIFQNLGPGGLIAFSDYLDWVVMTANEQNFQDIAARLTENSDLVRHVCAIGFRQSYYLDADLRKLSPRLIADIRTPRWYDAEPVSVLLWCGIMGTSSGMHSDVKPNCNVQVIGRKHFILFGPSQSRALYRLPNITHCQFDPNLPDLDRFPMARGATGLQCTLAPGECLYIPVGWYHQVTVASDWAINVNFFWPRPFGQSLAVPVLWRFLARRAWAHLRVALSSRRRSARSR